MADGDGAPPRRVAWVTGGSRGVGPWRGDRPRAGRLGGIRDRAILGGRPDRAPARHGGADGGRGDRGRRVRRRGAVRSPRRRGGPGGRGADNGGSRPTGPARQQRVGRLREAERPAAGKNGTRRSGSSRSSCSTRCSGGGVRAHYVAAAVCAPLLIATPAQPGGDGLGGGARDLAARAFRRSRLRDGQDRGRPPRAGRRDTARRARRGLARGAHPDWVRTEGVLQFADQVDLSSSQSPEGVGRAIVALADDQEVMGLTGQALTVTRPRGALRRGRVLVEGRGPDVQKGGD